MNIPARLLSGTAVSSTGRVVGTLLSVATIAIITRSLTSIYGDEGIAVYGMYATVLAYLALLSIAADGGLYTMFARDASREGADERAILERVWRARIIWAGMVLACGTIIAFVFFQYPFVVRLGIVIGAVGTGFQLLSQLLLGVFQRRLRLASPAIGEIVGRAVQLAGVIGVVMIHPSVLGFVCAFVLGAFITLVINVINARRFVYFHLFGRSLNSHVRLFIREAWPIGAALFLSVAFFKIDTVMLSFLKPSGDVGLYALPFKVLESLLFFPAAVGGMLLPVFSRASYPHPNGIVRPLKSALDLYLIAMFPVAAALFVAAPFIILFLAGDEFAGSVPILRILAVALGALFLGNLFGNALIAIGQQRRLFFVSLILMVVNITANFILIPPFSAIGAAWATLGTQVLSMVFAFYILLRAGVSVPITSATPRILASGILLIAVLTLPFSPQMRLAVAGIVYIATLFFSDILSVAQIRRILKAQRV